MQVQQYTILTILLENNVKIFMYKGYVVQIFAGRLDHLILTIRSVVKNIHSTGTDVAEAGRNSFAA